MIVVVAKYLIPKGYAALTLFPFVILANGKSKSDAVLINHENIHIRQQLELLVFPFFIWYFFEYLILFIRYKKHHLAYRNIGFEKEAYDNEKKLSYLPNRKLFRFLHYIGKR